MSVGSPLVQPSWEPHGLHSFPFHLHWGGSCSELAAAFLSHLGQSWGKTQCLTRASPFPVACGHQAVFSPFQRRPCVPFAACRATPFRKNQS